MKEALYYTADESNKVRCMLCPKECVIFDTKTGICGVRKNLSGKLYSGVYKKPIAVHIDPIEKKPLYRFHKGEQILSIGTFGCNLSCKFCQNYEISQKSLLDFNPEDIDDISPDEIINLCKKSKLKLLAFTYNEPTIFYEYMLETAKLCKKNDIGTVMISNGQIKIEPLSELTEFIDAFNIDLKAFNNSFYKNLCGGDLETTKDTIKYISSKGKHLEVTFLLIENFNDRIEEFVEMCKFLKYVNPDIVLHISRAFPRYKLKMNVTPGNLLSKFQKSAQDILKYVYIGNV